MTCKKRYKKSIINKILLLHTVCITTIFLFFVTQNMTYFDLRLPQNKMHCVNYNKLCTMFIILTLYVLCLLQHNILCVYCRIFTLLHSTLCYASYYGTHGSMYIFHNAFCVYVLAKNKTLVFI